MRILQVSCYFPFPPTDGNILPMYHFLRLISRRAQIHYVTLKPDDSARLQAAQGLLGEWGVSLTALDPTPVGRVAGLLRCLRDGIPWPNSFYQPVLARETRRLIAAGGWDVIHAEGIMSAQHLPADAPLPRVLVSRDCLSELHRRAWRAVRRPRELLLWRKIRAMERCLYRRAERVIAISPEERRLMESVAPGAAVRVVPNGVNVEEFFPRPEAIDPECVVFSGAMSYRPNIDAALWLAREIWPRVVAMRPSARLRVVGRDPVAEVRALADGDPTITVTGAVPSMADELARAAVMVSPLRYGGGIKNKVLEGAAMGNAMVVSPVSLQDIELEPGRDLEVAESAGEFTERVLALLADPGRRAALGAGARAAVARRYRWEVMADLLFRQYEEAIEASRART